MFSPAKLSTAFLMYTLSFSPCFALPFIQGSSLVGQSNKMQLLSKTQFFDDSDYSQSSQLGDCFLGVGGGRVIKLHKGPCTGKESRVFCAKNSDNSFVHAGNCIKPRKVMHAACYVKNTKTGKQQFLYMGPCKRADKKRM